MSKHEANYSTVQDSDVEKGSDGQHLKVKDHRKLAICSIICGLSCIGFMSLIYSVKTEEIIKRKEDMSEAKKYSDKALKWGVGAMLALVAALIMFPLLVGLVSYLLTFID